MAKNALDLLDEAIADLEARLNLPPGGDLPPPPAADPKDDGDGGAGKGGKNQRQQQQQQQEPKKQNEKKGGGGEGKGGKKKQAGGGGGGKAKEGKGGGGKRKNAPAANHDQPDICKLEFKVGVITKVWVHPDADKLYCEEIDVGEPEPRRIASGLRAHYDEASMLGRRLLVVSNLKAKNLVGFKSHGMVLCAAGPAPGGEGEGEGEEDGKKEIVEFVEPPEGAPPGEIVTFEGLPPPEPFSPAQVEKKKVFASCLGGMKTNDECVATWNGHAFVTSAGPCKSRTIRGGAMR